MSNLKLDVHTADGKTNGGVELQHPSSMLRRPSLMHQVVTAQLAAKRQGAHATKGRGGSVAVAVSHSAKGTGRARQAPSAHHFTGGGTVHGPQPRDYSQRTPKKMKAAALRGALSDRARHSRIHVIEELVPGQIPSASPHVPGASDRAQAILVVLTREDLTARKSVANLPNARTAGRPAEHLRRSARRRRRVLCRGTGRLHQGSKRRQQGRGPEHEGGG